MIELKQVRFLYAESDKGVSDISFSVKDGECVVLTGPSGGGKTTLTRLINGLAPSYYSGTIHGEITLNQTSLQDIPNWKIGREIGSVFQDPKSQFFSSELAGEVAFGCENYGLSSAEIREKADGAIRSFGLDRFRDCPLDILSSGEKQRTAIASVYALSPHTYVCDEPTANLDEKGTAELASALKKLKSEGRTLIIAEHRLSWLTEIADRFLYIANGKLLWERTNQEMGSLTEEERIQYGIREIQKSQIEVPPLPQNISNPILSAEGIGFKRGKKKIFEGVNLSLQRGQIVAVTGQNGAGKTSLAMTLAGLLKESGGEIRVDGKKEPPAHRRKKIWYSSNDTGTQFFTDSVTDELLLGVKPDEAKLDRARELLKQLGLYAYKDCHPASLSGGQKQRLSIACGILSDRPILILDEPTSGLDGGNMEIIADVLEEEANYGRSILVITHDTEWINRCCSYIYALNS